MNLRRRCLPRMLRIILEVNRLIMFFSPIELHLRIRHTMIASLIFHIWRWRVGPHFVIITVCDGQCLLVSDAQQLILLSEHIHLNHIMLLEIADFLIQSLNLRCLLILSYIVSLLRLLLDKFDVFVKLFFLQFHPFNLLFFLLHIILQILRHGLQFADCIIQFIHKPLLLFLLLNLFFFHSLL